MDVKIGDFTFILDNKKNMKPKNKSTSYQIWDICLQRKFGNKMENFIGEFLGTTDQEHKAFKSEETLKI